MATPLRQDDSTQIQKKLQDLPLTLVVVLLEGGTLVENPQTYNPELVTEVELFSYLVFGSPIEPLFDQSWLSQINIKNVDWSRTHLTTLHLNFPVELLRELLQADEVSVKVHQNPQTFYLPRSLEITGPTHREIPLPTTSEAIYNDLGDKSWLQVPQPVQIKIRVERVIGTLGGPRLWVNAALIQTLGPWSFYLGLE
jgi:hypothetical protein